MVGLWWNYSFLFSENEQKRLTHEHSELVEHHLYGHTTNLMKNKVCIVRPAAPDQCAVALCKKRIAF